MSKHFLSLLSFSLLLFTSFAIRSDRSEFDRFNQCQLDNINALEPDHRVESEAGLTETWNPNHPELQCTGVSLIKRTIDPNGLHLPSYSPSPQLIFIIQGKGVLGLSVPGCPETFEELQSSQSRQGSRQQPQQRDSHQKIRRFYKGDIIAIPAGIPYWTYNHGNEPLVAISLLDTSNDENQLDSTPRVFYLGGNPEAEFPETQEEQQGRHQQRHKERFPAGRRGGQHQQEQESEEQNDGNSVLSGFSSEFLAQALNTNEDVAKRLQSPRDKRNQIVRVEDGLRIISPEWQQEDEEEEERSRWEEDEDERSPSRWEKEQDERRTRHGRKQRQGDESEDEKEEDRRILRHHKQGEDEREEERYPGRHHKHSEDEREEERYPGRHGHDEKDEDEDEDEEYEPHRRSEQKRSKGERENGLEETICSAKIRENIARPERADLYNPRAGCISTVNSLTLPILRRLRLSAEYVRLFRNGIYAPHWNINANSLMYVIRGQGRVRIVNNEGNAVFDDRVRKGQLLVVPQNFVVAQQAENEEGFEYVVFKTNDRASVSHVKQVFSATPAEVLANVFGLRLNEVTQIKSNWNRSPLVQPQSQSQ
ncbi:Legumin type B [Trifolium repens]|nr:Legumin type B [Trifolium repens]